MGGFTAKNVSICPSSNWFIKVGGVICAGAAAGAGTGTGAGEASARTGALPARDTRCRALAGRLLRAAAGAEAARMTLSADNQPPSSSEPPLVGGVFPLPVAARFRRSCSSTCCVSNAAAASTVAVASVLRRAELTDALLLLLPPLDLVFFLRALSAPAAVVLLPPLVGVIAPGVRDPPAASADAEARRAFFVEATAALVAGTTAVVAGVAEFASSRTDASRGAVPAALVPCGAVVLDCAACVAAAVKLSFEGISPDVAGGLFDEGVIVASADALAPPFDVVTLDCSSIAASVIESDFFER